RPGDAAAMAALAEAATGADYFRTRAGAVEALAELPATSTAAPLAAALRDSSAQVRRAAIAALGQLGGPRAAELARATSAPTRATRCGPRRSPRSSAPTPPRATAPSPG